MSTRTEADAELKSQGANGAHVEEKESFAETALKLGGKSAEEARRTGAIDKADDQVEDLFKFRTTASPIHRAVWDAELPVDLFASQPTKVAPEIDKVMTDSMNVVRRHRDAKTLYNDEGKITDVCLNDLGGAG